MNASGDSLDKLVEMECDNLSEEEQSTGGQQPEFIMAAPEELDDATSTSIVSECVEVHEVSVFPPAHPAMYIFAQNEPSPRIRQLTCLF